MRGATNTARGRLPAVTAARKQQDTLHMKTWIRGALLVSVLALPLAGCFTTTINHGHVIRPERVRDIHQSIGRDR